MGKALYRKYRSRSLDEIIGQEHITTTLSNALKSGKIAHAYLLTGPRGVGKTSIARILAYEINSLPYSEEPNLDIIEIDAASNNGVEDVRDLREKIPSAPVSAKYKVFIIDEVHMLSKAAFNALLKTLEEPPAHVIFILATTEAYKLPDTIISRTQRFSFRPVPSNLVVAHLRTIAGRESINIDDDALSLIAEHGEGSFRDSISLLDQASSITKHIQRADVEKLLGLAPTELILGILQSITNHDITTCLVELEKLYGQGYEPAMIAVQLSSVLRSELIETQKKLGFSSQRILIVLRDLLDVPGSRNPKSVLEITVLSHAQQPEAESTMPVTVSPPVVAEKPTESKPTPAQTPTEVVIVPELPAEPQKKEQEAITTVPSDEPVANIEPLGATKPDETAVELWKETLQTVKKSHNTLYGIARMAKPTLQDDTLTLEMTFAFHQKRLNEPRNKSILADVVNTIRAKQTKIVCIVTEKNTPSAPQNDSVAAISNIFGSAELLES